MNLASESASGSTVRTKLLALCGVLGVVVVLAMSVAGAQSERHGVRIRYTSIASAGGLEGRAFLPVSSQGVAEGPHPSASCAATRAITVRASVTRGPLRAVMLRFPVKKSGRAPISSDACTGSEVEATLEDQSVLRGGQGYIELEREPSSDDPTFRGNFAQTVSHRGAPLTLEGSFVVPAPKPPTP